MVELVDMCLRNPVTTVTILLLALALIAELSDSDLTVQYDIEQALIANANAVFKITMSDTSFTLDNWREIIKTCHDSDHPLDGTVDEYMNWLHVKLVLKAGNTHWNSMNYAYIIRLLRRKMHASLTSEKFSLNTSFKLRKASLAMSHALSSGIELESQIRA